MTATHTISERVAMFAAALVSIAVAGFVTATILPIRRVLTQSDAVASIGLLLAAALLSLGVALIVDGRRRRRAYGGLGWTLAFNENGDGTWTPIDESNNQIECEVVRNVDGSSSLRPIMDRVAYIDPLSELQRHLTDALSVMLRHPELTVDAATLRLLGRKPPRTRGKDGRFKSGRA
ncbi:hypothetical protein [Bradyrhizobium sp. Bra64]|uniref:hypothetical protein n=1 Tax=Bradyrhizobium sp. Bra64 TaxID=2926009 RepID=UPI0021188805|nr:hypothetical protein [Bradyrhizobium sp. Bra64]